MFAARVIINREDERAMPYEGLKIQLLVEQMIVLYKVVESPATA